MYENTLILGSGSNTFLFNTKDATGAPITLAGTPSLALRVNGSATQATAGLTLTVDFDSVTGLHQVTIDVDNGTLALADGNLVEIEIAAGTVDSISVVGTVLARLTISDGSLLAGTVTAIRAALGLAAANLDTQIGNLPTNAELATALGTADDAILARLPAALVGGRIDANIGSVAGAEVGEGGADPGSPIGEV